MFHTIYLDERVALSPSDLNDIKTPDGIKDLLLMRLQKKHEAKCNANGYVRPGSIELLGRSMGVAENGRFTGNLLYDCKFKCEVLYPTAGTITEALVIKVNKMGAYAVFEEAIRILLPRDLHIGNMAFDSIKEGSTIRVRIERTRFGANDGYIMAVGTLAGSGAVETQLAAPEGAADVVEAGV